MVPQVTPERAAPETSGVYAVAPMRTSIKVALVLRMLTKLLVIVILMAGVTGLPVKLWSQERERNAAILKPYLEPETISRLEWQLMNFNISWQGAFTGPASSEYITSFPVWFDSRNMRFAARFRVSEKRDYKDPEPFFNLPKSRREAILMEGISALNGLLEQHFPEIKNNAGLLYVDFQFRTRGGGSSILAKYEAGKLSLSE